MKKIQYFKSKDLCGWDQLSQVGPSRAGPTAPGPARDVFKSRAQARPGLWDFNPTRRRPRPARDISISLVVCLAWPMRFSEYFRFFFALCLLLLEVSRPQRVRQPAPSGVFGQPLAVHNLHTKQSLPCPYTGLRIPLVPRGLRNTLIRRISKHELSCPRIRKKND